MPGRYVLHVRNIDRTYKSQRQRSDLLARLLLRVDRIETSVDGTDLQQVFVVPGDRESKRDADLPGRVERGWMYLREAGDRVGPNVGFVDYDIRRDDRLHEFGSGLSGAPTNRRGVVEQPLEGTDLFRRRPLTGAMNPKEEGTAQGCAVKCPFPDLRVALALEAADRRAINALTKHLGIIEGDRCTRIPLHAAN